MIFIRLNILNSMYKAIQVHLIIIYDLPCNAYNHLKYIDKVFWNQISLTY